MSALFDARAHLAKAEEFLMAAELAQDMELFNAATSDAVISGINSKDAICLTVNAVTNKSDNHNEAIAELKTAGRIGVDLAPTLKRLLRLKTKSQNQTLSIARADAANAVKWAKKLYGTAQQVVTS